MVDMPKGVLVFNSGSQTTTLFKGYESISRKKDPRQALATLAEGGAIGFLIATGNLYSIQVFEEGKPVDNRMLRKALANTLLAVINMAPHVAFWMES